MITPSDRIVRIRGTADSDTGSSVDQPGRPDSFEAGAGRSHHVDQDVGRRGGVDADLTVHVRLHDCEVGDRLTGPEIDVRRVGTTAGTGVDGCEADVLRLDDRQVHEDSGDLLARVESRVADRESNDPISRAPRTVGSRVGHATRWPEVDRCVARERGEPVDDEVHPGRGGDAHVASRVRLRHHQIRSDRAGHHVDVRGLERGESAWLNGHEARRVGVEGGDVQRNRAGPRISNMQFEFDECRLTLSCDSAVVEPRRDRVDQVHCLVESTEQVDDELRGRLVVHTDVAARSDGDDRRSGNRVIAIVVQVADIGSSRLAGVGREPARSALRLL